ncbi:MAG: hypothetical protein WD049_01405 [Candidatus Paceibacterota bacterium]
MNEGLMLEFAQRTGLTSGTGPQRYLWTDAFAVCNFLELNHQAGDTRFLDLAVQLVDQVHHTLGQHRSDDPRRGWISGLADEEGARHPTAGGLRIGKPLRERRPDEPFDERLEWERDGQYFHYLTKWMHALQRLSQVTSEAHYCRWAIELAQTAHARFTYTSTGSRRRMHWKMSIDLSRPLVPSQGQHDPLDGLITYQQLSASGQAAGESCSDLAAEIDELARMCDGEHWQTTDPLGLGGLLVDLCRTAQLLQRVSIKPPQLFAQLLDSVLPGVRSYAQQDPLQQPAAYRLGFRELGFSIGLRAVQRLRPFARNETEFTEQIEQILRHQALADEIEAFWRQPANREVDSWTAHGDINEVMLATSLAPDGYLGPC